MDEKELLHRHKKLLRCLSCLPKHMVAIEDLDNITEFVLHGLCNKDCFDLDKAACFVDNPDFDCFKGIAGFSKAESASQLEWDKIWSDPEGFSEFMQESSFNKRVRNFLAKSLINSHEVQTDVLEEIAQEIGIEHPLTCAWDMRYFNKGFLIYEKNGDPIDFEEHFINSLHLLSFCPIF